MKNFIFVAGVDDKPVAKGQRGTDNNVYCERRYKELYLKQKASAEDLNFYFIDILRGKINLYSYTWDATAMLHTESKKVHKSFDAITSSNYYVYAIDEKGEKHYRFHPKGSNGTVKNIISKYDIYSLIEEIGKNNPGTLVEVSIYSHAYFDGPILVNSQRNDGVYTDPIDGSLIDVPTLGKDPNDYDMRRWDLYQYFGRQIPSVFQQRLDMAAAFTTDGMLKIWGCSHPPMLHQFISFVRTNKTYKKVGLLNDDSFEFPPGKLTKKMRSWLGSYLASIRGISGFTIDSKDKVVVTWLELKTIFCEQITAAYSQYASIFFNVNVMSALPATYADISPKYKINVNTIPNVEMYKTYFGFKDGLGDEINYGIYIPDYDCTDYL